MKYWENRRCGPQHVHFPPSYYNTNLDLIVEVWKLWEIGERRQLAEQRALKQ